MNKFKPIRHILYPVKHMYKLSWKLRSDDIGGSERLYRAEFTSTLMISPTITPLTHTHTSLYHSYFPICSEKMSHTHVTVYCVPIHTHCKSRKKVQRCRHRWNILKTLHVWCFLIYFVIHALFAWVYFNPNSWTHFQAQNATVSDSEFITKQIIRVKNI